MVNTPSFQLQSLLNDLGVSDKVRRLAFEVEKADSAKENNSTDVVTEAEQLDIAPAGPHQGSANRIKTSLFPYQQSTATEVIVQLLHTRRRRALVAMPTGAGKTRTAIACLFLLANHGALRRVLWLAPSKELIVQARESVATLHQKWNSSWRVLLDTTLDEPPSRIQPKALQITTATLQLAFRRLVKATANMFDLMVCDEVHLFTGTMGSRLIELLPQTAMVLGLTATPGKSSEQGSEYLSRLFGNRIIVPDEMRSDPVQFLEAEKVRSILEWRTLPLPTGPTAYRASSLSDPSVPQNNLASNAARFASVTETVASLGNNCSAIVFAASRPHMYALCAGLQAKGSRVEPLSYLTPPARRETILSQFARNELKVLVNKSIVSTGVDIPSITDIFFTVPIRSSVLWEQMIGRASRGPAVGGTERATVWEFDDHRSMHSGLLSFNRFNELYT